MVSNSSVNNNLHLSFIETYQRSFSNLCIVHSWHSFTNLLQLLIRCSLLSSATRKGKPVRRSEAAFPWERQVKITGSDRLLSASSFTPFTSVDHHRQQQYSTAICRWSTLPEKGDTMSAPSTLLTADGTPIAMTNEQHWQQQKQTPAKSSWDQVFRQRVSSLEVTELALSLSFLHCRSFDLPPNSIGVLAYRSICVLVAPSHFCQLYHRLPVPLRLLDWARWLCLSVSSSGHTGERRPCLDTQLSSEFREYFDNDAITLRTASTCAQRRPHGARRTGRARRWSGQSDTSPPVSTTDAIVCVEG